MMFGQSAERISARRVARLVERLAEAAADDVPPDVRVTREGPAVVLSGRRLRVRSIDDAGLRGIGLLAKDLR